VEERLSRFKLLFFILIVGVGSNVAQYLISGPYFLGFSGVVVGLVGFIWARQKLAPWEGYPLNRTTFIFVAIFVLGMFALEIISLLTAVIFAKELSANIANTAHIVGGLVGYLLGRTTFFSRGPK
jgi:GlpG protein